MTQASAGGARLGPGSRPAGPRPTFEQPMHKIWGRLEEVSVGDDGSSEEPGSSEKIQRMAERLEGVQVEDSWDTSNSNSWERAAGAVGAGGGRKPPAAARAGPGAAVQEGWSCGSMAPATSGSTEASGRVSRQVMALALFGPMAEAEPAARGGDRQDPPAPCYDQVLHDSGQCRPCHYFVKKGGCVEKDECRFCHLEHEAARRLRPCKVKRERCKNMVESLASKDTELVERMGEISERSSLQGSYMRTIMATQAKVQLPARGGGTASDGDSQPTIAI